MKPTREYIDVCNALDEKYEQVMQYTLENFVFRPEIANLTFQIKKLKKRKEELEEMLYEEYGE